MKESVKKFLFISNFLRGFFIMKVVENSPQNARNYTIFTNFLGGACPETPLTTARSFAARDMPLLGMYNQNPQNLKVRPIKVINNQNSNFMAIKSHKKQTFF